MNTQDQKVTDYLLYDMPRVPTELGLVLGNRIVTGFVATEAARLYQEGYFSNIVISGGLPVLQIIPPRYYFNLASHGLLPDGLREKECAMIKRILLRNGVKKSDILVVESKSNNTGKNIQNTQSILEEFNSINIMTVAYHQRRAHSTLRRYLPDNNLKVTTTAVYPFGITRDSWPQTPFAGIVRGEFDKVDPNNTTKSSYIQQGFCVPIDPANEMKNFGTTVKNVSAKIPSP